jgi:hypothetical protein
MTVEPGNLVRVDFGGFGEDDESTTSIAWRLFVTGPAKAAGRIGFEIAKGAAKELIPDPGVILRNFAYVTTAPLWRNKKEFLKAWDANPRLMWSRIGPFSVATVTVAYVLFRIVEGTKAKISPAFPDATHISKSLEAVV